MKHLSTAFVLFLAFPAAAQWSQVNNGFTTLTYGAAAHGATPAHLFARAYNELYRSTDHGDSWEMVTNPIAGNPSDVGHSFNGRYFAGSASITACIHYTENDGDTWNAATGAPSATVVRGFFEYGGALYAYTSTAGIYRTLDGETWSAVNNGLTNLNVIGMAESGPYFVAATIGGGVFRTFNAATWTPATGIGSGDLNGENVWRMGSALYYAAQGGAVYKSMDYGDTWTAWTPPAFFGLGMVEVKRFGGNLYMETRHLAGGQRDSVYISGNEGGSWTNITGNLDATDLNGSGLLEHEGYVFFGYNMGSAGEGLYRYALSTSIEPEAGTRPAHVFPNPAHDVLNVVAPGGSGAWNLADAAGRLVLSGRTTTATDRIDVSALAPGCYLLRWDDTRATAVHVVKR